MLWGAAALWTVLPQGVCILAAYADNCCRLRQAHQRECLDHPDWLRTCYRQRKVTPEIVGERREAVPETLDEGVATSQDINGMQAA